MQAIQYDVQLLFRLWHDSSVRTEDIAKRMGVSNGYIYQLAKRHKLPRRKNPKPQEGFSERCPGDPTPEEIEERKRELRERHFAKRRAEPPSTSDTRAWRNRTGNLQGVA